MYLYLSVKCDPIEQRGEGWRCVPLMNEITWLQLKIIVSTFFVCGGLKFVVRVREQAYVYELLHRGNSTTA